MVTELMQIRKREEMRKNSRFGLFEIVAKAQHTGNYFSAYGRFRHVISKAVASP
jgi:hypothetical protein